MCANRLDLTSTFTDLSFEGFVEILQNDEAVIYRFPEFTIGFVVPPENVVKHIRLDTFSALVAQNPPETSTRDSVPISLTLDMENTRHTLSNIEFQLPKRAIVGSEYIKFGVQGEIIIERIGETGVLPGKIVGRAVWPISATGNRWIENPGARRPQIRYKTPTDPDDPCARQRIR
jgi:hypothetical protein